MHDYQVLPVNETLAMLDRVCDFFRVHGGQGREEDLPDLRRAFATVIPFLQDVAQRLSAESIEAARMAATR